MFLTTGPGLLPDEVDGGRIWREGKNNSSEDIDEGETEEEREQTDGRRGGQRLDVRLTLLNYEMQTY